MFCENCGKPMKNDDVFCSECGKRIVNSTSNMTMPNGQMHMMPQKKKSSKGIIIGLVVGIIAVLIVLVVVIVFMLGNNDESDSARTSERMSGSRTERSETEDDESEDEEETEDEEEKQKNQKQKEDKEAVEEEQEESEVDKALDAYDELFQDKKAVSDDANQLRLSLAYLDSDEIPECVIWMDPYVSYGGTEVYGYMTVCVLSYQNGSVLQFTSNQSGCDTIFYYKEGSGEFCVEEILGLRSATWWEIEKISNNIEAIGSAWTDNNMEEYFYSVLEQDTTASEWATYLNSFGFDKKLTKDDWYSTVESAYKALENNAVGTSVSYIIDITAINDTSSVVDGTTDGMTASEYVLPTSNCEYLTVADLQGLTAEQCRIARNELYARHGRMFNDEALQAYFNSCSWYIGTTPADQFNDAVLNVYEIANRDLIVQYEQAMGYQ